MSQITTRLPDGVPDFASPGLSFSESLKMLMIARRPEGHNWAIECLRTGSWDFLSHTSVQNLVDHLENPAGIGGLHFSGDGKWLCVWKEDERKILSSI
ncbi:MAG: hypothetical protein JO033_09960 [Acidobacteriaceae bacterium]|nr:hypothetical protein [Acidobacteriaceae bacterium]MBV9498327.1 hypothetical protein [Acidobacteriaceae bacterium]